MRFGGKDDGGIRNSAARLSVDAPGGASKKGMTRTGKARRLADRALETWGGRVPKDPVVAQQVLDLVWETTGGAPEDAALVGAALRRGASTAQELYEELLSSEGRRKGPVAIREESEGARASDAWSSARYEKLLASRRRRAGAASEVRFARLLVERTGRAGRATSKPDCALACGGTKQ